MGSVAHLTGESFKSMTGTQIVHVAYKGSAPALADLMTGAVQIMFAELSTALPLVRSGKLRALAVGSEKPTPLLPGVPALSQSLPGFVFVNWQALLAPPGTPAPVVERISAAVAELLKQPEVSGRLTELSLEPVGTNPAETAAFLKQESERWGRIVRVTGTKLD
jgi:tripartite-type tricarboxylate transporter receptor subunit TctC